MASTQFQDYNQNNPIVSAWLNDINNGVYTAKGIPKKALQSSAAWVRFVVNGGVPTIQQSSNMASVTRTSAGLFVINYANDLTNVPNCYVMSSTLAGFNQVLSETQGSVTVLFSNTADVATDPVSVSVVVFGAN